MTRRVRAWLILVTALTHTSGCESTEALYADDGSTEAGDSTGVDAHDAHPDDLGRADVGVSDSGPIACEALRSAYLAYVEAHRSCASVDDCAVIGAPPSCGCSYPSLGAPSGEAIRKDAVEGASPFFTRMWECFGDAGGPCDALPAKNLRCAYGLCTADYASCIPIGDSGPPTDGASD